MLVLNKDKEDLLIDKYDFKKELTYDKKSCYYKYGKSFTIYSCSYERCPGKVEAYSFAKVNQDIIYKLIKDDVIFLIPNEDKQAKINSLKSKISILQEKLKKYEEEN